MNVLHYKAMYNAGSVATLILETLNSLEQTPCATQT